MTSLRTNMSVQPKKWIRKVFEEPYKAVVNVKEKLKRIVTVENQTLSYQSSCTRWINHLSRLIFPKAQLIEKKNLWLILYLESEKGYFTKWTRYWSIHRVHGISFSQRRSIGTVLLQNTVKTINKTSNICINRKGRNYCSIKNMPFIQFVDNQPVYAPIIWPKYENPDKCAHILPILGSFHIEISFTSAIYKQLKKSNIEDLLLEAGLIAQESVV